MVTGGAIFAPPFFNLLTKNKRLKTYKLYEKLYSM